MEDGTPQVVTRITRKADGTTSHPIEPLMASTKGIQSFRLRVPGGWLVTYAAGSPCGPSTTFVADPNHTWKLEITDETEADEELRRCIDFITSSGETRYDRLVSLIRAGQFIAGEGHMESYRDDLANASRIRSLLSDHGLPDLLTLQTRLDTLRSIMSEYEVPDLGALRNLVECGLEYQKRGLTKAHQPSGDIGRGLSRLFARKDWEGQ